MKPSGWKTTLLATVVGFSLGAMLSHIKPVRAAGTVKITAVETADALEAYPRFKETLLGYPVFEIGVAPGEFATLLANNF